VRFDATTQRIIAVGDLEIISGEIVIDAKGLALARGSSTRTAITTMISRSTLICQGY